ncbi:ABC transporter, ATP-binding protein [Shigella boydii ATCC 9905]|nr:ABC transporter, ATP-binding protein [Shigella boydii ATCC 9905]
MVAIFGDNGSGKSTLAQLMAGWYPDFLPGEITGSGTLLGTPIGHLPLNEQSATIQLVQQSPYLQLSGCTFSVEEEVAFGPENLCLAEAEIMARIDAALTLTECQPLRHRHPATLSGGETQRVVIACAIAMQPKLLILDEAFSRLTPQASEMLLQRLQHWAFERGSLIILFERHRTPFLNYLPASVAIAKRSAPATMLTLNQISYRWPGAATDCLCDISLQLKQGEWLALTGDNGAGKSTLLRVMAGLLTPTAGTVMLQQQAMKNLKNRQHAAKIGVLFQEAENQLFHSTVADEIAFGLKLQKCPADEITQRTHAALQCCQLADTANAHPLDLHSAQRRMVAVACLEALSPPLLLLDEPSRDFDENWLSVFESWLEKCGQRGTSVVAISHDAAFTRRHFSRVVRLEDGLIRNVNPPDDIHP